MGITKRAGRKKDAGNSQNGPAPEGQRQAKRAVFEVNKKKEVGVSDLTLISKITNEAINDNLKLRFENAEIYTYIGHVLVSVNPFKDLGIYTKDVAKSYEGKNRIEASPHVFAVAESAYHNMQGYHANQCVIISGESGAGKTEAAKRLMEYIAQRSGRPGNAEARDSNSPSDKIKQKVLATNPLLESFGNAKTLRNNNSSRFGKYLELQFQEQTKPKGAVTEVTDKADINALEPVGARITNYLLEKSRVVGQTANERNFHIFYQFTKAASEHHKTTFGIQGPESYEYLSRSRCLDVAGINDKTEFQDTLKAMETINIDSGEQDSIFQMVATVLWIGNVSFVEDDNGNAAIRDTSVSDWVAALMNVNSAHVEKAMTLRVVETSRGGRRGSVYEVPLNVTQATAVRDALAKAIYFNLFDWIVAKLNRSLNYTGDVDNTLGILDIYGFEIFEKNSFEQLCINYVNEKLQQIFIQLTLKAEQDEYAKEQIQWTPIKYFDNKIVCELIEEKRPPGIFAALNDACATAHADSGAADQTFVARLNALSSNPHFQSRQGQFVVKHYAGEVNYAVTGMTDKNKDQLLKDLLNLVAQSQDPFVRALFPNEVNQDDRRRPPTAGDKIKASANDLVTTLMKAEPSYIRTIKPNENKSPSEYNTANVMHQIKYLGLQENVRIRRSGFAYRQSFEKFFDRFFVLSRNISYGSTIREDWQDTWGNDYVAGTKTILRDTSIAKAEYQMGVSKVFIKSPETIFALEDMRDKHQLNLVIRLQRMWRNVSPYRHESAARIQRCWRRGHGGDEYQKLRDYGHTVLQGRKERRRFSLIGYRRYLGDYLGINMPGGSGEGVRRSIGLNSREQAIFSSRCDLLVTKFGRSSKPEPRMLVVTGKAIYIVAIALVNKQASISSERTIPLGAVKFVSTSMFRDDWFSLGVSAPQQADPLINCVFKNELITQLKRVIPGGSLDLRISDSIEYNKKPGKPSAVKVIKDPSVQRDDYYKSGSVHTGPGEPPTSMSKPTPRGKPKKAGLITRGWLIRPSRPKAEREAIRAYNYKTLKAARSEALRTGQPLDLSTISFKPVSRVPPASFAQRQSAVQQSSIANPISHDRNTSSSRAPPPPPPVQRTTPKTLFISDFPWEPDPNSYPDALPVEKGEVVELHEKIGVWFIVSKLDGSATGTVPANYLTPHSKPAPPPAPPAPPVAPSRAVPQRPITNEANGTNGSAHVPAVKTKAAPPKTPARPSTRKKPAPLPNPRASTAGTAVSNDNSGRSTPDHAGGGKSSSMASGLAAALQARNNR